MSLAPYRTAPHLEALKLTLTVSPALMSFLEESSACWPLSISGVSVGADVKIMDSVTPFTTLAYPFDIDS